MVLSLPIPSFPQIQIRLEIREIFGGISRSFDPYLHPSTPLLASYSLLIGNDFEAHCYAFQLFYGKESITYSIFFFWHTQGSIISKEHYRREEKRRRRQGGERGEAEGRKD